MDGKHVLLVSHRPTELVQALARELTGRGARVTLALRHTQDARYLIKRLGSHHHQQQQHAPDPASPQAHTSDGNAPLRSSSTPLNVARLASVHEFAGALNSSREPLDLLVLDSWDLYAAGTKGRRWYTPQGMTGTAQTGFVGPAVLLHLLRPKLAADGTAVLLTASPGHRLIALDDLQDTLSTWGHTTLAATQAALLAYVRRLALQLNHQGVRAAAVDLSLPSEWPLKGSLLRKLPVLRQALHLLLPSAHDAARLLADVAAHMLSGSTVPATPAADELPQAPPVPAAGGEEGMAEADHGLSAGTRWDPQHSDTPALQLLQESGPADSASAAGALPEQAAEASGAATEAAGAGGAAAQQEEVSRPLAEQREIVPDTEASSDQSAAFDIGYSVGRATKTATALAQATAGSAGQLADAAASASRDVGSMVARGALETATGISSAAAAATAVGASAVQSVAGTAVGSKPFSYVSRGLLATPLITSLDHAGSSTWTSRTLHTLTGPLYDLTSASLVTAASLADWPVRALLLGPAGVLPSLLPALGPLGGWVTRLGSQLQGLVPGVVGVPLDAPPAWVEVTPSGAVLDDKLGWRLWHLVEGYAGLQV